MNAWDALLGRVREAKTLGQVAALVAWDQETQMPPKAHEARAQQLSLLSRLGHEIWVSAEMGELLERCLDRVDREPISQEELQTRRALLREVQKSYLREKCLSSELVGELAREQSLSQQAWAKAKEHSEFEMFAPHLERILQLKLKVVAAYRDGLAHFRGQPDLHPYEILLDEYEPRLKLGHLEPLFGRLAPALTQRVRRWSKIDSPELPPGPYAIGTQEEIGKKLARAIGFDFEAGRLDVSSHPFCTSMSPSDVRITTRYRTDEFMGALFGILHESGHGLYEQGLPMEWNATPLAEAASMAIHESQSRLWENGVGRSLPFWKAHYAELVAAFPALGPLSVDQFHHSLHRVRPSLIRTESDETTYNLHIVLRFELEKRLVEGRLSVSDLPRAWNKGMEQHLGVVPTHDREGCLQDIHWSMGAFGYFPSYTLGNLYAAQLLEAAERDLPELWSEIALGRCEALREWLREKIHRHGMRYSPEELCMAATGRVLTEESFLRRLDQTFSAWV